MNIFAVDPGPTKSAYIIYDTASRSVAGGFGIVETAEMLRIVREMARIGVDDTVLVVEMISSYGKPVGASVFETCVNIGRIVEAWSDETTWHLLYRHDCKMWLCHSMRAKDSNIRQALLDKWGGKLSAVGTKKTPGPLYGVSKDVWAALAVAVTWAESREYPVDSM